MKGEDAGYNPAEKEERKNARRKKTIRSKQSKTPPLYGRERGIKVREG